MCKTEQTLAHIITVLKALFYNKMLLPKCIQMKKEISVCCHKSARASSETHIINHFCLNSSPFSQQDDHKSYFTIGSLGGK